MTTSQTFQFFIPVLVMLVAGAVYSVVDATRHPRAMELARITFAFAALVVLWHLGEAALVVTHTIH